MASKKSTSAMFRKKRKMSAEMHQNYKEQL